MSYWGGYGVYCSDKQNKDMSNWAGVLIGAVVLLPVATVTIALMNTIMWLIPAAIFWDFAWWSWWLNLGILLSPVILVVLCVLCGEKIENCKK